MEQAQASGFLAATVAVAFVSADIYQRETAPGYVVTIGASGKTRIVRTGKLDNGLLAVNGRRQVSVTSETTSYVLGDPSSSKFKRGGRQATGHWAGTREDGSFVNVFNSGVGPRGYETDIYWSSSSKPLHSVMPDVPGATGVVDDVLYTMNSGSSTADGVVTLFRTNLRAEPRTDTTFRWRHWGSTRGHESSEASDIFGYRGKLWFLETISPTEEAPFPDGAGEKLRLAELNPAAKTYSSTEVASYQVSKSQAGPESPQSDLAIASRHGHLHEGKIHTLDHTGTILAIDLATKKAQSIGQVSAGAANADHAAISWHRDSLTVLYYNNDLDRPAKLETYDLNTGQPIRDLEVKGLNGLIQRDPDGLILWDIATLPE